VVWAF